MTDRKTNTQMEGLATLLVINDEIRKVTNIREFGFFTTKETHRLIPYQTVFLWKKNDPFGVELLAQSGTPELDKHALVNQWLKNKITTLFATKNSKHIHQVDLFELDSERSQSSNWPDTSFPNYLLWCPLFNKEDELNGGLLYLRETAFTESEIKMIGW